VRVLLTGAFGNVGAHALVHLADQGYQPFAFDIENPRNKKWSAQLSKRHRFTTIWGDLRSPESIARAVDRAQPDAILHLAAVIAPTAYVIPEVAYEVNVMGIKHLLAAAASLATAPQIIFSSSYAIHGPRNPHRNRPPLTSEAPIHPADNYGRHKAAGEKMVRASGLPWTIVRLPTVCATAKGWGQSIEFFRIAFLLPLERRVHVLHSRDAGLALVNAIHNERAANRVFIAGGPDKGCRITGYEFFMGIGEARGIPFPPSAFRIADPEVDESWYYEDWVDTKESQEVLRYQQHTFADYLQHIRAQTVTSRRLLKLIRPLVRRRVVKASPYFGKEPTVSSESLWSIFCETFDMDPDQR
jgi:nucleoside-diphosphate-sugar epimerase